MRPQATIDVRVRSFMSAHPWTVHPVETIEAAERIMTEHGVRLLPVVENGRVVGIVSRRDLGLGEALLLDEQRLATVEDVMTTDVYVADSRDEVGVVAKHIAKRMAERKIGSAIIVARGTVVGIFTTIDALNALEELTSRCRSLL